MGRFVIAGLVLGGIYALSATGLVLTYQASGVFNFAFSAVAFTVARFYYFLHSQRHWGIVPAAVVAILGLGPTLGILLYSSIFRFLRLSPPVVKVMATVGVSVALPPLTIVLFGNQSILSAPGLAPEPVHVFHLFGVPITTNQIIVYCSVLLLLGGGFLILRYTDVGLQIRAIVDSPAMTSLSGTNPGRLSMMIWAVSITIAGLVGVLAAPIASLDPSDMTYLMVTAFAACIAARLRSLPIAVAVGLAIGIAGSVVQYLLPASSTYTADFVQAIPFIVILLSLSYFILRSGSINEQEGVGGALDLAIRPQGADAVEASADQGAGKSLSWRPPAFGFALLLGIPFLLHGFWIGELAQGIAFGIIFLSFSLVTGEGGMIWLCQGAFAGAGAMTAALLTADQHVPVLVAVVAGGLVALPFGVLIGLLTIRMGDIYVALTTLGFGILVDDVVFTRQIFSNNGSGVLIHAPHFANGTKVLTYLCIGVFAAVAIFLVNLRRSSTGLALGAVRSSPAGSRTLGVNIVQMKLILAGMAAFVAGIGGAMLAITLGSALPTNYGTLSAEVWLAVLVTQGLRSNSAALAAGLGQTLVAGLVLVYLPSKFQNFVPVLFGLGAIAMVKFPEGVLTMQARQFRNVMNGIQRNSHRLYQNLKMGSALYVVAFIVLVVVERHLWWLWLAITVVLGHVVSGYLFSRGLKGTNATQEVELYELSSEVEAVH